MDTSFKISIGFFALVLVSVISFAVAYKGSITEIEIYVKDKERITQGSGDSISSKFLIYADDEVFENTDSFLFWKFNSSDIQNGLEPGETYTVTVAGWRVQFLSWYRNVIEIKNT